MPQTNILRILKSLILNICSGASTWLLAFDDGNLLRRNTSGGFLVHERETERERHTETERKRWRKTQREIERNMDRETQRQKHRYIEKETETE